MNTYCFCTVTMANGRLLSVLRLYVHTLPVLLLSYTISKYVYLQFPKHTSLRPVQMFRLTNYLKDSNKNVDIAHYHQLHFRRLLWDVVMLCR